MAWQVLKSPVEQWAVMPSFLVGEYLFIAGALLALWHAASAEGAQRRRQLAIWIAALVAGTANDLIFMALPLVDNFWQAQATIMLTPRLPLYIPCVYVWFMYLPTVATSRLGLPRTARAAAAGLAAIVVYAPYDIVGAKYLWWTWHDTDKPIGNRLLGAPIGSSIWVITFVAAFAWCCQAMFDRDRDASRATMAKAVALAAGCSTLIMVAQMTVLQQLDGGVPGIRGLVVIAAVYLAVAVAGLRRQRADAAVPADATHAPRDRALFAFMAVYFASLFSVAVVFAPEAHRSESVHQTVGECHVAATDVAGLTRFEFLCVADYDEDFSFACAPAPPDGSRWYTVCGRPHTARGTMLLALSLLGLAGIAAYRHMLARPKG